MLWNIGEEEKMVDREARRRSRGLLKKLALGRITNYECENEFLDLLDSTSDPVVFALYRTIREVSGETEHVVSNVFFKGGEMRNRLCRWIVFLKTDLEYQWPEDRLAPGLRDLYRPTLFDKLSGRHSRIIRSNTQFFTRGDYSVWPFLQKADFEIARSACRACKR
jgi:hypothetical protein